MFKYLAIMLIVLSLFSVSVVAQENTQQKQETNEEVATVGTFTVMVITSTENKIPTMSIRIYQDGSVQCKHRTQSGDDSFTKITLVEVITKLTDQELKSVNVSFEKLRISTLKTKELDSDEPPDNSIIIEVSDGKNYGQYASDSNNYGIFTDRVTPFIQTINKIAERLK